MIRRAVSADMPEIERVMRAAMADLGAGFYDAVQVASAVRFIAVADRQIIEDGTYFVIEDGRSAKGTVQSPEATLQPSGRPPFSPSALGAVPSRPPGRVVACGGWSARAKLFSGPEAQENAASSGGRLDPALDRARIRAMFVDPAHARRGLGRRILQEAEADAARAGFRAFELMATLPGVPLYRACGYEEIERVAIELPDGTRLDCIRMERALSTADR